MRPRPLRIGIVGAGPAGLIAAIAGAELGLDVTLFEQASCIRRVGSGFGLQSNGLRVLEALGLLEAFRPKLHFCQTFCHRLSNTAEVCFDLTQLPIPHNAIAVVLRADLQAYLLDVARQRGIRINLGHRCTHLWFEGDRVTLAFANGETATFDVVVACDGTHSVIREALPLRVRKRRPRQAYLRGVVPLASRPGVLRSSWGPDGRLFGICPLPGAQTFFLCSAPLTGWEEIRAHRLDAWIESWRDHGVEVVTLLEAVTDWEAVHYDDKLHEVLLEPWYKPPVFFAGDAAHAMLPESGQGANCAMTDALVLMRLLARCARGDLSLEEAGKRYDAIRRPFVTRIQQQARRAATISQWRSAPARWIRDGAFWLAAHVKALTQRGLLLAAGYNPEEEPYLQPLR